MEKKENNMSVETINVVLCDVLGYSKQCFVLEEIQALDAAMKNNTKYRETLSQYQEIDSLIAIDIKECYDKDHNKNLWNQFYKLFLSSIATLVVSGNYDGAILKYMQMMEALSNYFGITSLQNINKKKIKMLAS